MGSIAFGMGIVVGVIVGILLCYKDYDDKVQLEHIVFTDEFLSYCSAGGIEKPNVEEYKKYLYLKEKLTWELRIEKLENVSKNIKKLEGKV